MNETQFADWIGRKSESVDIVTPRLAASYRAIFGDRLAKVGDGEAPLGIHWCLSPAIAPMEALGPDGHPAKNRDLPPIPQPRRMWAGGSVETLAPIGIGDTVERISTIGSIHHGPWQALASNQSTSSRMQMRLTFSAAPSRSVLV